MISIASGGEGVRRIGVDPVGRLLGPTAGLISDVSKAAGAPIGAATGDAITDSQAAAVMDPEGGFLPCRSNYRLQID